MMKMKNIEQNGEFTMMASSTISQTSAIKAFLNFRKVLSAIAATHMLVISLFFPQSLSLDIGNTQEKSSNTSLKQRKFFFSTDRLISNVSLLDLSFYENFEYHAVIRRLDETIKKLAKVDNRLYIYRVSYLMPKGGDVCIDMKNEHNERVMRVRISDKKDGNGHYKEEYVFSEISLDENGSESYPQLHHIYLDDRGSLRLGKIAIVGENVMSLSKYETQLKLLMLNLYINTLRIKLCIVYKVIYQNLNENKTEENAIYLNEKIILVRRKTILCLMEIYRLSLVKDALFISNDLWEGYSNDSDILTKEARKFEGKIAVLQPILSKLIEEYNDFTAFIDDIEFLKNNDEITDSFANIKNTLDATKRFFESTICETEKDNDPLTINKTLEEYEGYFSLFDKYLENKIKANRFMVKYDVNKDLKEIESGNITAFTFKSKSFFSYVKLKMDLERFLRCPTKKSMLYLLENDLSKHISLIQIKISLSKVISNLGELLNSIEQNNTEKLLSMTEIGEIKEVLEASKQLEIDVAVFSEKSSTLEFRTLFSLCFDIELNHEEKLKTGEVQCDKPGQTKLELSSRSNSPKKRKIED